MSKRYIRENMNPCAVPVLFVLKKIEFEGCALIITMSTIL
jgi:hypothetical protein